MRAWFALLTAAILPAAAPGVDPLAALNAIAARSPARAREGLATAIGDIVEMTNAWPLRKVADLDMQLTRQGLPGLAEMRARFSRSVQRAVRRGRIEGDVEYHAVRNAAEMWPDRQPQLSALLAAYEERVGR